MERAHLEGYLDEFLKVSEWKDHCPNGLQVEGREEVQRIVTGVSASAELFEKAISLGADTVLVHHGLLWGGALQPIRGVLRERLRLLLAGGLNLFAYHLPLDAHPEVGNNARIARALGLEEIRPFGLYEGQRIGVMGLTSGLPAERFFARVEEITGRKPLVFAYGPQRIRQVGIVSGGAAAQLKEAVEIGLDAYITGEPGEPSLHLAKEGRVHFIAAGHYATERFGVKALGEHLAEKFSIEVQFVELQNPV